MANPIKSEHSDDGAIIAYGPPFDDADADAILRSSDRVDFLVYKIILSKASPVFKSMFALPQPGADIKQDSRLVIEVTENSKIIAPLLSAIYPDTLAMADSLSLKDYIAVLDMARKYDMGTTSRRLIAGTASNPLRGDPFEAFCAAYSCELGDAAQIAARASLKHRLTLDNIGEKLQYINGSALHKLWKHHRACSVAAIKGISSRNFLWISPAQAPWSGATSTDCRCSKRSFRLGPDWDRTTWSANSSWDGYIDRALVALKEHPCSEAITDQRILRPSYHVRMCDECRQRICGLSEFSRMLGEEVERIVSKVRELLCLP
jgi:BTB/POZ domain